MRLKSTKYRLDDETMALRALRQMARETLAEILFVRVVCSQRNRGPEFKRLNAWIRTEGTRFGRLEGVSFDTMCLLQDVSPSKLRKSLGVLETTQKDDTFSHLIATALYEQLLSKARALPDNVRRAIANPLDLQEALRIAA